MNHVARTSDARPHLLWEGVGRVVGSVQRRGVLQVCAGRPHIAPGRSVDLPPEDLPGRVVHSVGGEGVMRAVGPGVVREAGRAVEL